MLNDIGVVDVELELSALQYILAIWSAVSSPNHAVSSSVNVSTYHKYITPLRRNIFFFQMSFSYDKIIPVSAPLELLKQSKLLPIRVIAIITCFSDFSDKKLFLSC